MSTVFNRDSIESAGVFLSRQLEQRLPKVYSRKYPALRFASGQYLPVTTDLEVGADSVVEEILEEYGEAGESLADQVDDIPLADVGMSESRYPIVVKPIAFRYSVRELAAAQKANRDVRGMKEQTARNAIERAMNKIGAIGDLSRGVTGLINDPNVDLDSSITANYYDNAADADALVDLFSSKVSSILQKTYMTEEPDTILVPVSLHERLTSLRLGDSATTVKKFILENNLWIKDILPCNELGSDYLEKCGIHTPGMNKDEIFIYARDPEIVSRKVEPLTVLQPQLRGLVYVVIMFQASTGAINHYPGSALRVAIPKAV